MSYSIKYYRCQVLGYVAMWLSGYVAKWAPYPSTYRLPPLHQHPCLLEGSDGLRRPPRKGFREVLKDGSLAKNLPRLNEGFFWPVWEFKVDDISLPKLWKEPRVNKLVITMAQSWQDTGSPYDAIIFRRSYEEDTWTYCGQGFRKRLTSTFPFTFTLIAV